MLSRRPNVFLSMSFSYFIIVETICPVGWNLYQDSCVKINDVPMKFDDAKAVGCKEGSFVEDSNFGAWAEVLFQVKIVNYVAQNY